MLRPHTFSVIKPSSFVLVTVRKSKLCWPDAATFRVGLRQTRGRNIMGFYIKFRSKTMVNARAYFPNLSSPVTRYAAMCPVRALKDVTERGYVRGNFLQASKWGKDVTEYISGLISSDSKVPLYALRIGGRTWNISHGLDRQFVDYLGTWKSPEASARYYREAPGTVLQKMRAFYDTLPDPRTL